MSGFSISAPMVSFTPVLKFGGATTGITYTTQLGRYVRVGNKVTVNIVVGLSSKGSAAGTVNITGLPFASNAGSSDTQVAAYMTNGVSVTNVFAYNVKGDTQLYLQNLAPTGSATNLTDANFGATSGVMVTITYFI